MTDLAQDDHRGHRWGRGSSREIVSRTEHHLEVRDRWRSGRILHSVVEIDPPNAWRIRGQSRGVRWDTTHTLEDLPDGGCRITTSYVMEGVGIGKLAVPLLRRRIVRFIRRDMDLHVADMEEQLGYRERDVEG